MPAPQGKGRLGSGPSRRWQFRSPTELATLRLGAPMVHACRAEVNSRLVMVVYDRVLKFSLAPGKQKSALPTVRSAPRAPDIIRLGVSALSCWPGRLVRGRRGFWPIAYSQEFQQNSV